MNRHDPNSRPPLLPVGDDIKGIRILISELPPQAVNLASISNFFVRNDVVKGYESAFSN